MLKSAFTLLMILFISASCVFAVTSDLNVIIKGVRSDKGNIMLALCSTEEQYKSDNDIFRAVTVPALKGTTSFEFEDLPEVEYALKVFHDRNSNGKLDKGLFGIPSERYGFSNDPEVGMGMPEYAQSVFFVHSRNTTKVIRLR